LGPSDMFGELSVFDPGPRTSSATTITAVRAVSMDRDALRTWIADRPEIVSRPVEDCAGMPRACWSSQSWSGRSQRRSSGFTLQFPRPAHRGGSSGCSTQPIPSKRGRTGGTVRPPRRHAMTTPAEWSGRFYSGWSPHLTPLTTIGALRSPRNGVKTVGRPREAEHERR
jgi:hypothetical protein